MTILGVHGAFLSVNYFFCLVSLLCFVLFVLLSPYLVCVSFPFFFSLLPIS